MVALLPTTIILVGAENALTPGRFTWHRVLRLTAKRSVKRKARMLRLISNLDLSPEDRSLPAVGNVVYDRMARANVVVTMITDWGVIFVNNPVNENPDYGRSSRLLDW